MYIVVPSFNPTVTNLLMHIDISMHVTYYYLCTCIFSYMSLDVSFICMNDLWIVQNTHDHSKTPGSLALYGIFPLEMQDQLVLQVKQGRILLYILACKPRDQTYLKPLSKLTVTKTY